MLITNNQIAVFENHKFEKFVARSILYLKLHFPAWTKDKDDSELSKFIDEYTELGKLYKIFNEVNIQKIMKCKLDFEFNLLAYRKLQDVLTRNDQDEDVRVENFYNSLASGSYRLVQISFV